MPLDGVVVAVTIAFDTFMPQFRLFVQIDMTYRATFDNQMSLYMKAGGGITVPCTELGDVSVFGKMKLENIPVGYEVRRCWLN
jgi:hypothetical protein